MAVTAAQVGEYFIEQYYQILQQQPEFVFQQYSDASTVVRVDGSDRQTATTMLMIGGDFGAGDFEVPANVEENGLIDNYSFLEQRLHQVPETAHIHEDCFAVQSNGSVHSTVTLVNEHPNTPVEEPAGEPQKHTYASVVAKGKSAPAVPTQFSLRKITSRASERHCVPDLSSQWSFSKPVIAESFGDGTVEDFSAVEDKVKIQSVYVKNVPSTASASEIAKEFRKFGKLRPNGVAIRARKDVDVHYAFVEFEDITGVQNAIKASTVLISGQQVYIEGRRANRVNELRGGKGSGKSKGGYHRDASQGRFGARKFTKGGDQYGKHNRLRGNGYYEPTTQQAWV